MRQEFVSQEEVGAVAELLSRVSWDEEPTDMEPGIDETDEDAEDEE